MVLGLFPDTTLGDLFAIWIVEGRLAGEAMEEAEEAASETGRGGGGGASSSSESSSYTAGTTSVTFVPLTNELLFTGAGMVTEPRFLLTEFRFDITTAGAGAAAGGGGTTLAAGAAAATGAGGGEGCAGGGLGDVFAYGFTNELAGFA